MLIALFLTTSACLVACSDDDTGSTPSTETDAGSDAGSSSDLGVDADAGTTSDTGTTNTCTIGCLIDTVCYPNGVFNPLNICQVCDISADANAWSYNIGQICDDGLFCNGTDTCGAGACTVHELEPCPDDGFYCNGTESCSDDDDTCHHTGDPCTEADELCIEADDQCCVPNVPDTDPACNDDGDVTALDSCGYELVIDDCADTNGVCDDAMCGCAEGWGGADCGCVLFVDSEAVGLGDGSSWDNGFVTVQEAVDEAITSPGGCAIWVKGKTDAGLSYLENITLYDNVLLYGGFAGTESSFGDRDVETNVTILDGNGSGTVITYRGTSDGSKHAVVNGFTVRGGIESGMRIEAASPTISNCTFSANTAPNGGGIYAWGSDFVVTNTAFNQNRTWDGGIGKHGISDSPNGGNGSNAGHGAGIFIDGGSPVISGCVFTGNIAGAGGTGGLGFDDGDGSSGAGGVGGHGGAIYITDGSPTISDCGFTDNAAGKGGYSSDSFGDHKGRDGGSGGSGGAIYVDSGSFAITDSTFTSNTAGRGGTGGESDRSDGGYGGEGGDGGAVFATATSSAVSGCTFSGNAAGLGGDAGDGDGDDGPSGHGGDGGGAYFAAGNVALTDCTFDANTAGHGSPRDEDGYEAGHGGDGGGVFLHTESAHIEGCTFSNNTAGGGGPGGDGPDGGDGGDGGGVYVHLGDTTLLGCTFKGNTAGAGADDDDDGGHGGHGGGIYVDGAPTKIVGCSIEGNSAGSGGIGDGDGGNGGRGGGVHVNAGQTDLWGCLITGNAAGDGGDGDRDDGGNAGWGGGIFVFYANVELANCTVVGNTTGDGGAGDVADPDDHLGKGGGVYNNGTTTTVVNSIIWGNTASGSGPQLAKDSSSAAVLDVSYSAVEGDTVYVGTENINTDPEFGDAAGGNLHLKPGSPRINEGNTDAIPDDILDLDDDDDTTDDMPFDLDGNDRVVGSHVDMGAYEYYLGCGNWVIDDGEECDDGNATDGDGCSSTCTCERRGTIAMCPATDCGAMHGSLVVDDFYWLEPLEGEEPYLAYCDMNTDDGGWTMVLRLDSNDGNIQWWGATDFWEAESEIGVLDTDLDYLSPAYYTVIDWDEILVDYRYAEGQTKRMAAVYEGPNIATFRDNATLTPNNENPAWDRTQTISEGADADADNWYGMALRFQTEGNTPPGQDYFRIWYNWVEVNECNQAGGIGGSGDVIIDADVITPGWYHELSFPSTIGGCQENTHRGRIGSDGGGAQMGPTEESEVGMMPADAYEFGVMRVFVR